MVREIWGTGGVRWHGVSAQLSFVSGLTFGPHCASSDAVIPPDYNCKPQFEGEPSYPTPPIQPIFRRSDIEGDRIKLRHPSSTIVSKRETGNKAKNQNRNDLAAKGDFSA